MKILRQIFNGFLLLVTDIIFALAIFFTIWKTKEAVLFYFILTNNFLLGHMTLIFAFLFICSLFFLMYFCLAEGIRYMRVQRKNDADI